MKPGEYIGKDGRTYQAVGIGYFTKDKPDDWDDSELQYSHSMGALGTHNPDFPAAKAALDALVESEQGEWVEIPIPFKAQYGLRISRDGERPQRIDNPAWAESEWRPEFPNADWVVAYQKGLEVGEAKGRAVALEQVQELVHEVTTSNARYMMGDCTYLVPAGEWLRIRDLAQKVKA